MWEGVIRSVIYYKIGFNSVVMLDALVFNNSYVYYLNFYPSSAFTRNESVAAVCDDKFGTGSRNVLIHAFLSQGEDCLSCRAWWHTAGHLGNAGLQYKRLLI